MFTTAKHWTKRHIIPWLLAQEGEIVISYCTSIEEAKFTAAEALNRR
jgi:hypothetical protein